MKNNRRNCYRHKKLFRIITLSMAMIFVLSGFFTGTEKQVKAAYYRQFSSDNVTVEDGLLNSLSEYESIITQYFNMVSEDRQEDVILLYCDALRQDVGDFFNSEANKENEVGLFGVKKVEIQLMQEMSAEETYFCENGGDMAVRSFFVKCKMEVVSSDKYYREGVNYFKFLIGEIQNTLCIVNIERPSEKEIMSYDSVYDDAAAYIEYCRQVIYGIQGENISAREVPIYQGVIENPVSIRILLSNGTVITRDFEYYCRTVAGGEITVLQQEKALKACAMAIKMYAHYFAITGLNGKNYDVRYNDMAYNEQNTGNERTNKAMDEIFDYFLLDCYGSVFPTFFRKDKNSGQGEYCTKNGGILSQLGAEDLAGYSFHTWQSILDYYYKRSADVPYYNAEMTYGKPIVAKAHSHWYSYEEICITCGAYEREDSL